jgi:exodeoxyribonuclease VII large subunit
LRSASRALPNAEQVLALPRQRLDHAAASLDRALRANAHVHHVRFSRIAGRLSDRLLRANIDRRRERYGSLSFRLHAGVAANLAVHRARIGQERERVVTLSERTRRAVRQLIAVRTSRAERGGELLAAFSYRGVLARGFALVRDAKGRPLRTAAAVVAGMPLEIEFSDGRIGARAENGPAIESPTGSSKPRGRRAGSSGQGDLF